MSDLEDAQEAKNAYQEYLKSFQTNDSVKPQKQYSPLDTARLSSLPGLPIVGGVGGMIGSGIGTYDLQRRMNKPVGESLGAAWDAAKESYEPARKEVQTAQEESASQNQRSAIAGAVGGGLLTAPLAPINGVKGAMAMGAGYNALDELGAGNYDPASLGEHTLKGAATGGLTYGATKGISKGINALKNSAEATQGFANTQAVRAAGADLKTVRALHGKDMIDPVGQFALEKGIVKAGDSVESVAEKAENFRKSAGKKLDSIYEKANQVIDENAVNSSREVNPQYAGIKMIGESPENISPAKTRGFNPVQDRKEILSAIEKEMGDSPGKKQALRTVGKYLNQLGEDHGDSILSPKSANNVKSLIDKEINYARNPLSQDPASEQGYSVLRKYVNDKVLQNIEDVGKLTGNPDLADQLRVANKEYGYSKQLSDMSNDRVNRHISNRMFGLTDTIAGAGGGLAGGAINQAMGGDAKHSAELGLLGGAAGMITNKLGRTYAPGIMAGAANTSAPILKYTAAPVGNALSKVVPSSGLLTRAAIPALLKRKKEEENAKP